MAGKMAVDEQELHIDSSIREAPQPAAGEPRPKRTRGSRHPRASVLEQHNVVAWREANKSLFAPPICNKLMHKDRITVMFVGGPNSRTDFHLDLSSEFFYQIAGTLVLPTIQRGELQRVEVPAGHVYLLPSRVPHSPQRSDDGFGLVIERERRSVIRARSAFLHETRQRAVMLDPSPAAGRPTELDGMRWYTDFTKAGPEVAAGGEGACHHVGTVLWERYFHCGDLGRDLVPVVNAFKASPEVPAHPAGPAPNRRHRCMCQPVTPVQGKDFRPRENIESTPPFQIDRDVSVPPPFELAAWVASHRIALAAGLSIPLFGLDHPDRVRPTTPAAPQPAPCDGDARGAGIRRGGAGR
jgi:3-hydroxyanthranilate 3,4-dioxygenase